MYIHVCSFSGKGNALGKKIFTGWESEQIVFRQGESLSEWTENGFSQRAALVFIGAAGIAVRAIAPFVKDKLTDSPVIVLDECGRFVIPLLSGHVGGANALAARIAARIGGVAVITTATDVNHVFAADVFAGKNHLSIMDRSGIARVSGKLLAGERAVVSIQPLCREAAGENRERYGKLPQELQKAEYPPKGTVDILISTETQYFSRAVLPLKPKQYVLGMGCRKGKPAEDIAAFIRDICALAEQRTGEAVDESDIACLASIDRKREEPGLVQWAQKKGIPFLTFSPEELLGLPGEYTGSAFVEDQVGVDNVCERAAAAGAFCLQGPQSIPAKNLPQEVLVLKKTARDGMTAALAIREWRLDFDEA